MLKAFSILTLLYLAAYACADTIKPGDTLPSISAETLAGGNLELPKDASGKIALLIQAFLKKVARIHDNGPSIFQRNSQTILM
jgi:hypothetical protein